MKVVAFNGSPRKGGNTETLTSHCLRAIEEEGLEVELVPLAGLDMRYCDACYQCRENKPCPIEDDMYPVYDKMRRADGIILGSPVYSGTATALLTSLLERVGHLAWFDGAPFQNKVGGSLVVQGRVGGVFTAAMLNNWLQLMGVVIPGSDTWNIAFGWERDDVLQDEKGMSAARNFGKNVASLLRRLAQ